MTTPEEWPHSVTVGSTQLDTAQSELTVMLIRQNDQVSGRVGRFVPGAGRVIVLDIGIVLLFLIGGLTFVLFVLSLITGEPKPVILAPTVVSAAGIALLVLLRWQRNRMSSTAFRGIDRLIARTARVLLTGNRRSVPYTSQYRSESGTWVGEWRKGESTIHSWTIDPAAYKLAIVGPTSVGLWAKPKRQRPCILWLFDPTHRQQICDELSRAGVEVVDLPVETPRTSDAFKRMTTE